MLNKIKQIVARWANEGNEMNSINGLGMANKRKQTSCEVKADSGIEFKNPMNITLYNAVGGRIVKFYFYDWQTEQSRETTYIIPSDLDFEKELGKCISMEALKHMS